MKPQPPPSLLLGLEPVQSCLGVARVMSNYGYKKNSVPVIFEPPCIYHEVALYNSSLLAAKFVISAYFKFKNKQNIGGT